MAIVLDGASHDMEYICAGSHSLFPALANGNPICWTTCTRATRENLVAFFDFELRFFIHPSFLDDMHHWHGDRDLTMPVVSGSIRLMHSCDSTAFFLN